MSPKIVLALFSALILVQLSYAQCGSFGYGSNIGSCGQIVPNIGNCRNIEVSGNNDRSFGCTSSGVLHVCSGSPLTPSGLTLRTDDFQLRGNVAVGGVVPFGAAVALEGGLRGEGWAGVDYTTGPYGIGEVGCGVGLAGESCYGGNVNLNSGIANHGGWGGCSVCNGHRFGGYGYGY